ncbi:hypothetical protein [Nocardia sp. NPDC057227]|uniref:hypothetical protein n=1 Tax=Nocardia sp. NPDC057227 TaxID=3346056 RepID=UPI0036407F63
MSSALPQRMPFPRRIGECRTLPLPLLVHFAAALREWAGNPETTPGAVPRPASGVKPPVSLREALEMAR